MIYEVIVFAWLAISIIIWGISSNLDMEFVGRFPDKPIVSDIFIYIITFPLLFLMAVAAVICKISNFIYERWYVNSWLQKLMNMRMWNR